MKILIIMLLGLAAVKADKIVGGEDAGGPIPYQARIQYSSGGIRCGASLVATEWILTAAHCQGTRIQWSSWTIALGIYDSSNPGNNAQYFNVANQIPNADYNSDTTDNDVMLLKLSGAADTSDPNTVAFAQLPAYSTATDYPTTGTPCTVSGWGTTTEGGSTSSTLQEVVVDVVAQSDCQRSYPGLTSNMLCLGVGGGKDACQGDSGGPAVCNGIQYGIVSWGFGCARPLFPGVYTRVAVYRNWIDKNSEGATAST